MSCCEGNSGGLERYPGTGCCGTSCAAGKTGCLASEPRIRSCFCQENVGCLDRADCGGFRPRGTAATGACPGPCQCVEEEAWNRNVPPKPNCEWLTNFSELRRQWSDHGRQNNCKCCNCEPCRTAAPCKPCLPPPPACSIPKFSPDNCQDCCNMRLSGGACGQSVNSPSSRQRDCGEAMYSSGGCPPPSCNRAGASPCSPRSYSSPCSSPSESTISNPCSTPCRPPSSCQPCSSSPRPILKKRSCCQCISGYCMCQPMPRNCNCPPPIQVDARAERECSCECPSSPECACPPSERKFPRTKVKCPNARMCCPTPRPQPGPKCCCTKCQPCLPPPCDPCTSSVCRTVEPKVKPCCGDSSCPETSPCRPDSAQSSIPTCRTTPPCAECRKTWPPCSQPNAGNVASGCRPESRQMRLPNSPRSLGPRCVTPSAACRSTGQSRNRLDRCDSNDDNEFVTRADEGYGDDNGEAITGTSGAQCHCGPSGSRECDYSFSFGCDDNFRDAENICDVTMGVDETQCDCGNSIDFKGSGCAEDCDYCCSVNCDASRENLRSDLPDRQQCGCGTDGKVCAESCDYCCSQNCDSESFENSDRDTTRRDKIERIGAGGADSLFSNAKDDCRLVPANPRFVTWKKSTDLTEILELDSSLKDPSEWSATAIVDFDGISNSNVNSKIESSEAEKRDIASIKNTNNPRSACKLLRSLIRGKSPMKYL